MCLPFLSVLLFCGFVFLLVNHHFSEDLHACLEFSESEFNTGNL